MRGSTGALGVFGGIIRLRSSQGRQFGSVEAGLSEHVTTGARREHRSGRPAGTKPRAAEKASSMSPDLSFAKGKYADIKMQ